MKLLKSLVLLITIFIFSTCKKEAGSFNEGPAKMGFIDSAVQYLKLNLSAEEFAKLNLSTALPLIYHHNNIGLKVYEKGDSLNRFILVNKQHGGFKGNRVTMSGIKSLMSKDHSGTINVQSLDNKSSINYIIKDNQVVDYIKPSASVGNAPNLSSREEDYKLPEVVVTAYVDDGFYDFWSLYVLSGGSGDYSNLYLSSGENAYNSGAENTAIKSDNVTAVPTFISPDKPILDITKELKCFTIDPTSSYSISVNVNQPWPNSCDKLDPTAKFEVGHTFLTLEQLNADGSQITRTVGFYPKNSTKTGGFTYQSTFGDDSYTPYAVSLKIAVTGTELNTVINTLEDEQSRSFNLNNFNCTNCAMEALASINVNLPSNITGYGIAFYGNSPADLGQDIRELNLDKFSAQNGNREIVRTAIDGDNVTPDSRAGTCN